MCIIVLARLIIVKASKINHYCPETAGYKNSEVKGNWCVTCSLNGKIWQTYGQIDQYDSIVLP